MNHLNPQLDPQGSPIIIGAGIGGLSAGLRLAVQGLKPIIIEKEAEVGGKAHQITIEHNSQRYQIDGGPTVLTMLSVFEELFELAGTQISDHLDIKPMTTLARHFWSDQSILDLYTDLDQSFEAIRVFSGSKDAEGFLSFHQYTQRIYESVQDIFIYAPKPTLKDFVSYLKPSVLPRLYRADISRVMWQAIDQYFDDPRLKQLFARYATYTGNNPFLTPATFNLISAVEQSGVWVIKGGLSKLAKALETLIVSKGGSVLKGQKVNRILTQNKQVTGVELENGERLKSSNIVFNGDSQALFRGNLIQAENPDLHNKQLQAVNTYPKSERSLSALTACGIVEKSNTDFLYHNVYFSDDYEQEFKELEAGQYPKDPTIYFCAQDRFDTPKTLTSSPSLASISESNSVENYERIFALINAPARGDETIFDPSGEEHCKERVKQVMDKIGLPRFVQCQWMTPNDWNQRFPYSGGAIYGQGVKKWNSNLKRMGATSKIKGLYLVGGTVHPGAGVPMAALSGKWAAQALMKEYTSIAL